MLAILFGRPAIASSLLRALYEKKEPFGPSEAKLTDAVVKKSAEAGLAPAGKEAWDELARKLPLIEIDVTVGQCAREALEVARYSLVTGHDWHLWTPPPTDPRSNTRNVARPPVPTAARP